MQQPRVIIGLLLSALVLAGLACGERTPISGAVSEATPIPATPTPPPTAEAEREEPTPTAAVEGPIHTRFLLGGWVAPKDEDADDRPFADTLKAFVITTDEGLREFLDSLDLLRVRGSQESLNRADLSDVVVVAMYYLWRPLKGDPLSLEEARLSGNEVRIRLELVGDPQGRESPFLLAPLYIAALDREDLPGGVPLSFVFLLNGKVSETRTVTLE